MIRAVTATLALVLALSGNPGCMRTFDEDWTEEEVPPSKSDSGSGGETESISTADGPPLEDTG